MSHSIVIFGASGDLTSRKLIPSLFHLFRKRRLPSPTRVVGVSRSPLTDDAWRDKLAVVTRERAGDRFDQKVWDEFAASIFYQPGDINKQDDFAALADRLEKLESGQSSDRVYYLATKPSLYATAVAHLGQAGLAAEANGARRVVVEKPFGVDQPSARELTAAVHQVFDESRAPWVTGKSARQSCAAPSIEL